tara:strand:- start:95 stop:304 length:210 start_codon:yes stop_codon:yes gene_type:complete
MMCVFCVCKMIFEIEEEDIKVLNDRLISIGYENVCNKSMNEKIKLLINVINILEESERSLLERVEKGEV